jgi:hypothetical protein
VKLILVLLLVAELLLVGCSRRGEDTSGGAKTVIQYDAIPNYANWGGLTEAYFKKTGVRVPPDNERVQRVYGRVGGGEK